MALENARTNAQRTTVLIDAHNGGGYAIKPQKEIRELMEWNIGDKVVIDADKRKDQIIITRIKRA